MKRVFISIELPEYIKKEILKIQKEIDKLGLIKGKFTELENLHLTLKFLGEISDVEIIAVKEHLQNMKFDPFYLEIDHIGVFSEDFIKIIWLGVRQGKIFDLQKGIDFVLENLFQKENRFMGHITLARPQKVEQKEMFLDELKKIKVNGLKFIVDKFNLMESVLTSNGAIYKSLMEMSANKEIAVQMN